VGCPATLLEWKSILIDEFKTCTRLELGRLLSGRAEVKFHSSSAAVSFVDDGRLVGRERGAMSRRDEGEEVDFWTPSCCCCWNGEEVRGLEDTNAEKGSAAGGVAVFCGTEGAGVEDCDPGCGPLTEENIS
jgi:hypothetical protein